MIFNFWPFPVHSGTYIVYALCEIPSDYSGSLAKMASLDIVGVFCALGESS